LQLGDMRDGLPILRPEVVLLYKAKNLRERDQEDFEQVQSRLDPRDRRWLADAIEVVHPGHEWLGTLRPANAD
jgi:SpoU rRNA methylase family enzyme